MAEKKGKLFLIPTIIAEGTAKKVIPAQVTENIKSIRFFLAEEIRTSRRFLSSLSIFDSIEALHFSQLNKDTSESELKELMKPLEEGNDMGILSESGCPGVADPGAMAVQYAHQKNFQVIPLVGPSSILLALMASGLNGQRFAFHGYLPVDASETTKALKEFEKESKLKGQTQIFIETPYRNNALLERMLNTLQPTTLLTIACDISGENEMIRTQAIKEWKSNKRELPKLPALFLFLCR